MWFKIKQEGQSAGFGSPMFPLTDRATHFGIPVFLGTHQPKKLVLLFLGVSLFSTNRATKTFFLLGSDSSSLRMKPRHGEKVNSGSSGSGSVSGTRNNSAIGLDLSFFFFDTPPRTLVGYPSCFLSYNKLITFAGVPISTAHEKRRLFKQTLLYTMGVQRGVKFPVVFRACLLLRWCITIPIGWLKHFHKALVCFGSVLIRGPWSLVRPWIQLLGPKCLFQFE